jgi:hypothetical protein
MLQLYSAVTTHIVTEGLGQLLLRAAQVVHGL